MNHIPKNPEVYSLKHVDVRRKLYKNFFVPLFVVFQAVLYLSALTAIFNGWTTDLNYWLVFFTAVSVPAHFLLREFEKGEGLFHWYVRRYVRFSIPLLVLALYSSLNMLLTDGLYFPEYLSLFLVLWVLGCAVYMAFSKERRLQVYSTSFIALLLLFNLGPLSFSTVLSAYHLPLLDSELTQYDSFMQLYDYDKKSLIEKYGELDESSYYAYKAIFGNNEVPLRLSYEVVDVTWGCEALYANCGVEIEEGKRLFASLQAGNKLMAEDFSTNLNRYESKISFSNDLEGVEFDLAPYKLTKGLDSLVLEDENEAFKVQMYVYSFSFYGDSLQSVDGFLIVERK